MPIDPSQVKWDDEIDVSQVKWDNKIDTSAVKWDTQQQQQAESSEFYGDDALDTFEYDKFLTGKGMPWSEVGMSALTNVPQSAMKAGENILYPITHMKDFAKSMGGLISGDGDSWEAVGQALKETYGSEEAVKKYIAEDPINAAIDGALLLSGVGLAAKGTKVGQMAATAGRALDPLNAIAAGGSKLTKKMGQKIPGLTPEGFMMRAMKKGLTKTQAQQTLDATQTMLEHNIPVSRKGMEKLFDIHQDINKQIGNVVEQYSKQGDTIPRQAIIDALDGMRDPSGPWFHGSGRKKNIKAINKQIKEIIDEYPGDEIPVKAAHKYKMNTDRVVAKDYGKMKNVQIETKKTAASEMRRQLAKKYPELAGLNAASARMYRLEPLLDKAVDMAQRRGMLGGLGAPLKVGVGATLDQMLGTPGVFTAIATAQAALSLPEFQQKIGRILHQLRKAKLAEKAKSTRGAREGMRKSGQTLQQTENDNG